MRMPDATIGITNTTAANARATACVTYPTTSHAAPTSQRGRRTRRPNRLNFNANSSGTRSASISSSTLLSA